ncbi:MAG: acyloxyacyl hydrolase [Pseudomonadota bacterium]
MQRTARLVVLLFLVCVFAAVDAAKGEGHGLHKAESQKGILAGYGVTHTGIGDTRTTVQDLDLLLRYGRFLTDTAGRSWYQGRHELIIELPFYYVVSPKTASMAGINFLACWDFTAFEKIVPYLFAGGGLIYTDLGIPGLGSSLNGNYQGGIGFHYFIKPNVSLDFNYRLHHISNAGTAEPNEPLNSSKILAGFSLFN